MEFGKTGRPKLARNKYGYVNYTKQIINSIPQQIIQNNGGTSIDDSLFVRRSGDTVFGTLKINRQTVIGIEGNYLENDEHDNLTINNNNEGNIVLNVEEVGKVVINGDLEVTGNIIGQKEVSSYGNGDSEGGGTEGGSINVDGRTIDSLKAGEGIIFSGSGSELVISSTGGLDIPQDLLDSWNDIVDKSHTHDNKTTLDSITANQITNWDQAYEDLNDWFYKDSNGVHSKYNFIGDLEVSSYGNGESGTTDSAGSLTVNGTQINSLTNGEGILFTVNNGNLQISATASTDDRITDTKINNWDTAYTWVNTNGQNVLDLTDWFYKDANGKVHSKYDLIGDKEISTYGDGESGTSGSSDNSLKYNGSNVNELAAGNNVSMSLSNGKLTISATGGGSSIEPDLSSYYTKTETDTKLNSYLHKTTTLSQSVASKVQFNDDVYFAKELAVYGTQSSGQDNGYEYALKYNGNTVNTIAIGSGINATYNSNGTLVLYANDVVNMAQKHAAIKTKLGEINGLIKNWTIAQVNTDPEGSTLLCLKALNEIYNIL